MTAVFLKILNMSITASIVAAVVLLLRLLLKRAPRALICALWVLVALRLVIPFTLESKISLMPVSETVSESSDGSITVNTGIGFINSALTTPAVPKPNTVTPPDGVTPPTAVPDSGDQSVDTPIIPDTGTENVAVPEDVTTAADIASLVWAIGAVLMVLYAAFSYLRIKLRVRESISAEKNIRICDRIDSPFILGIIRPKIYLPSDTAPADAEYIISHEKAHLKRLDHLWKPLGFLLLSLHWFNPVMWLAYVMLCRDIELACDEKVIRAMGEDAKKPYSDALISASVPRRLISACPLAFGEVGVKRRIKAVLSYKKPTLWIIIAAVLALTVAAVCLLTDRKDAEEEAPFCIEAQNSYSDMDGVWAEITETDTENGKMTVVWHNDTDKELTFGEEFYIYRVEESGQTVDTYTFSEKYAWNLIGYPVAPGGTFEKEYSVSEHEILKDTPHRYDTYFHITGSNPVPDGLKKYAVSIDFVTSESFIPESIKPAESDTPELPTQDVLNNIEKIEAADDVKCTIVLSGYADHVTVEGDVAKALYREVASSVTGNEKHFNVPTEQQSVGLSFTVNGFENSYYFMVFDNDTVQTELPVHTTVCKGYALKSGSYEKVKTMVEGYIDEIPSPEKLDLNQDLVADIGLTFEEMKAKHGEVVDYDVLNGGSHYKFENGYGFYFFYGNPTVYNGGGDQKWAYKADGTPWYPIPHDGCVCISIDNLKAKDVFSKPFEKLDVSSISSIDGVTLLEDSSNKMDIFSPDSITMMYSGFPTSMATISISYYDYISPESTATINIHPSHWDSFTSGNLPEFNEELLADIGLTFEEMKAKYGDVISFQSIDYGIHYKFERGYGQYFFKGKDDTNNTKTAFTSDGTEYPIPSEGSVCLSIINITASDVLSGDFGNMQIYDVGNIKGVIIYSSLDTEIHDDNRFCVALSYEGLPSRYASIVLYYRDGINPENRAKICVPQHLWEAFFDEKEYKYTVELTRNTVVYQCQKSREALPPSLTLFQSSGQFTFTYSYLSSYKAHGTYELTDDTLTLRTSDGLYTYVFDVEGDAFVFDEERSSPLPKYKYSADAVEALPPFGNGAMFIAPMEVS